jgi:NAD(P)-dependent dehydrogenase (short-subunit alcohol dehydrogenase family)
MQMQGKRVVITGAASGIGRDTALLLAREGAAVVIGDINEAGAAETVAAIAADGGRAWTVRTDVTSAAEMERLMAEAAARMDGIDTIINNAGVQRSGRVTEFDEADWDLLMEVNPKSCFLGVKYGVPYLRAAGGGAIVNTASLAGLKGGPGMTAYSASKGAIVAFTKALAAELAPDGIRVNAMCPGWIDTPFNQPAIDFMGGRAAQEAAVAQIVPLGRQGTPAEIAAGMLYLASDASSYMTGQALVIDGGVL